MPLSQENRIIKIATPLGENKLLLRSFSGQEEVSRLFRFDLDLLSEDYAIDPTKIVGKNVTISVALGQQETRFINGYVSRFVDVRPELRLAQYRAEVVPWFWFLTRTTDCRIYQKKTVPDIVEDVFKRFNFSDYDIAGIQGKHEKWEYCVQYRETSFAFVSRLLEEEGIFFYFRHEDGKHVMVLGDQNKAFENSTPDKFSMQRLDGAQSLLEEGMIRSWDHEYEFRPGKWTQTDFNFETPTTSLMSTQDSIIDLEGNKSFEIYDYPGAYETKAKGDNLTRTRIEEEEVPHNVVSADSNIPSLTAGYRFTLEDHEKEKENEAYILTSVSHAARQSEFYSEDPNELSYSNSFTCIPDPVKFRPARVTAKPMVHGLQTAIVVGPKGEEIYTDQFGRVKVQFHWDRLGKYDENSSLWIRVSHLWAGKRWGAVFHPRIGQEVIVQFEEGDPDRPMIVGRLYNGIEMPPYDLPGEQTKSTIKSYSSKGGDGFNEIRFEDKKGSEQLFIHAEKHQDIRVKKSTYETIGSSRHLIVGGSQLEKVGGDKHLTVTGNQNEKIDGTISREAAMDIQEKAGMSYAMDAGMDIHLKAGMKVIIEAGMQISLKVGGNFIDIGPAGVTIVGTMVKINSGGAAGTGAGSAPEAPKKPKAADKAKPGAESKLPPPKKPPKPSTYSPQATALKKAAAAGAAFCPT